MSAHRTIRRLTVSAVVLLVLGAVFVGYIPAHDPGDVPAWKKSVYKFAQGVVADLPEEDRDRVVLMPPGVSMIGHAPCWPLSLKWNSYSCNVTGQAVLGFKSYNSVYLRGRRHGIVFLVGHELGHLTQPVLSALAGRSFPRENNADCMGGAYVAEIMGRDDKGRTLLEDVLSVRGGRDPESWDFHGDGDQRVEAALTGYDGGTEACENARLF